MSRSERLLTLIEVLRRHRRPVSGRALAAETGVSLRTLYRDIASLQAQGATIEGEPGVGYVLRPGFMLPPLMFSEDELEALVLGQRWVARRSADARLGAAAGNALAKITAVLPADLRDKVDSNGLLVGQAIRQPIERIDLTLLRRAIRAERKLAIAYRDLSGRDTRRTIWPLALGFFDKARVVVGWCELRDGFRHFRTDRISAMEMTDIRYPKRRATLLKAWREQEKIPSQDAAGN